MRMIELPNKDWINADMIAYVDTQYMDKGVIIVTFVNGTKVSLDRPNSDKLLDLIKNDF